MAQAKAGDTVQVHYTGKLEDGTVFDSSANGDPLQFKLGGGQVIPGFENGVVGMAQGEKKTINIPPDDAYGFHRDDMVVMLNRQQFPPDITPEIGQRLQLQLGDGQVIPVEVTAVTSDEVTVDANHPLAGKTLIFELELVSIA